MTIRIIKRLFLPFFAVILVSSAAFAENAFKRELVVKDQTRKTKVKSVFKKLIQAYEDESASDGSHEFLCFRYFELYRGVQIEVLDVLVVSFPFVG